MAVRMLYVHSYTVRGKTFHYYRRHGKRIRLPDDASSPAFALAYQEAHQGRNPVLEGSIAALIAAYKASPEYKELSESTRGDYARYLDAFAIKYGPLPAHLLERQHVLNYRDGFQNKPATANYIVAVLRRLFSWGMDRGLVRANPAAKPKRLKTGPGHKVWPEVAIKKFREGAPQELAWALDLALATGQRQADVLSLTWGQCRGDVVSITQGKTGAQLQIPKHKVLKATLERIAQRSTIVLTDSKGKPWKADHFRHEWRAATVNLELDGLTFHGLRHTAATVLADAGCTDSEIQALTGHKTREMVGRYAHRTADQAKAAVRKMERHANKVANATKEP